MDELRRADQDVAIAASRWQHFKHTLRHPWQSQQWKIRARLNYINPFFYLGRIKNNIKYMSTGHY
jgi:hypothetical protein